MPHDDQYTAVGPSFTGAGFPRAGFSTKSTDTVYGANVVGTFCGVYGESLAPGQETSRSAPVDGVGVHGEGNKYGLAGVGRTRAGVLGIVRHRGPAGAVFGVAMHGVPGVVGQSRIDIRVDGLPTGDVDHGADGIGVLGESGSGTGVSGNSDSGPSVSGTSNEGPGGRFSSPRAAQLRLGPSSLLTGAPPDGLAGDLLAVERGGFTALWFCVRGKQEGRPAVWGKVHLDRASIPNPPLEQGAEGQDVKNAQGLFLAHGHDPGPVDGILGPLTLAATRAFQEDAAIVVDGRIGPQTWSALLNHF
ncbi:peptidoglycan-binding protein [Streptomyces sp. NPDC127106]|uniref:peptidoglycan-binding domain-containing protein n=1 Tax=Streptomyces sp. NPDC127106 TaxID=3345360 RepID=UPI003627CFDA